MVENLLITYLHLPKCLNKWLSITIISNKISMMHNYYSFWKKECSNNNNLNNKWTITITLIRYWWNSSLNLWPLQLYKLNKKLTVKTKLATFCFNSEANWKIIIAINASDEFQKKNNTNRNSFDFYIFFFVICTNI